MVLDGRLLWLECRRRLDAGGCFQAARRGVECIPTELASAADDGYECPGSPPSTRQGLSCSIVRYFYDTEFIEDGQTIELVSIGIVAEDGREFYAVSTDFDPSRANAWVRENVLDKLPSPRDPVWKPKDTIRREVLDFLTQDKTPIQLWAWVGAYDHVVLAQL